MKFRGGIKDNNNWLQSEFHWLFIWYFLQILSSYLYPIQTLLFNWIDTSVPSKSLGYLKYLFGVYLLQFFMQLYVTLVQMLYLFERLCH